MRRRFRYGPPPWWPARQRWPPSYRLHRGPARFIRRLGCLFVGLVIFTTVGLSILTHTQQFVIVVAIGALIIIVMSTSFAIAWRRVSRRLTAEDRLRRQLMADVAHELRTPLAILQGRIEGLLDGVYARDDARLDELLDETRHLSRLVEDLRTIANAEAGALELRKEPTDIGELIRDSAYSLDAPINVQLIGDLPSIDIDPVRIREVLLNLLSNALQHAKEVAIRAEADSRDVIIRVIDNGSGIPAEELPRIFDRFTKGAGSRGSGLGLAISRNLVLAHRGTIHAASKAGEGTTITVTLPR